jgi:hypothetical protein
VGNVSTGNVCSERFDGEKKRPPPEADSHSGRFSVGRFGRHDFTPRAQPSKHEWSLVCGWHHSSTGWRVGSRKGRESAISALLQRRSLTGRREDRRRLRPQALEPPPSPIPYPLLLLIYLDKMPRLSQPLTPPLQPLSCTTLRSLLISTIPRSIVLTFLPPKASLRLLLPSRRPRPRQNPTKRSPASPELSP